MGPGSDLGSRFGPALVMPVALGMIGLGLWVALGTSSAPGLIQSM